MPSDYNKLDLSFGWLALVSLALASVAFAGCQSGEQRTSVSGSGFEGVVDTSADAAPADKIPGTGDGSGEGKASGSGSQLTGKSLEQCTAEKKAWRAVIDSGNSPSACGESLVNWCCTRKEVLARFPTTVEKIESEFVKYIDNENHVLYHCSTDGGTKTTFHMAKVVGAKVFYRTVFVDKVFPVETGNKNTDCPVVTTKDLNASASPPAEQDGNESADNDAAETKPQVD